MITGQFNGWNIVASPSAMPGVKQIQWDMQDLIGDLASPYSGQSQVQDWMTDWWSATVTLPPLPRDKAKPWLAFFGEMRGKLNVFSLGDPYSKTPDGSALGVPVCKGINNARSRILNTSGWQPNTQTVLKLADFLQIGYRLHMVVSQDVDSDAAGNATINLWPSLREAPQDGDPLNLASPTGLFRLRANRRSWQVQQNRLYTISFEVKEAL